MKRALEYHLPGESLVSTYSLEEYIRTAERRGDEEYKIQTSDGFVVYERFYSVLATYDSDLAGMFPGSEQ